MAEIKTQKTTVSITDFLNTVPDEKKRQDSFALLEMMRQITGSDGAMWGDAIVGFVDMQYKYATGRSGDWFKVGFSPRKQNLTIYIWGGFTKHADLLAQLGKHKTGSGCLYVNKLSDVNLDVLKEIIHQALKPEG